MSLAEIILAARQLSREERSQLMDELEAMSESEVLQYEQSPEFVAKVERRMAAMDRGEKIYQEEVVAMHEALLAKGR